MYGFIRLIIGIIFLSLLAFLIKKSNIKRKIIVLITATSILMTVIELMPFENLFITFSSPESVYDYIDDKNYEIVLTVEGAESALVVGVKENSYSDHIIPKTDGGWKISTPTSKNEVAYKNYNNILIRVYRYKNTDEYYISVFDAKGGETEIVDAYGTEFHAWERYNELLGKEHITYFAYLPQFDVDYRITVNGEVIKLNS